MLLYTEIVRVTRMYRFNSNLFFIFGKIVCYGGYELKLHN